MKRQALVVGINQYPFLADKPGDNAKNLLKPATDAEAIAQCLETYGDFEVHRLPTQEGQRELDPKGLVKIAQLEAAIIQLFHPQGNNIPETALLFFAGHGLRRNQDGETEGFLATSEASPRKDKWGISLKWLRKILEKSPVRQQLIWLDCCHSGELFNFSETDLGEYLKGCDRSFIAASREFQSAYGGVLTPALLQGLNPTQLSDGCVTNYTLKEFIEQALKDAPQHPILTNTGGQILLTGKQGVRGTICPYKGLAYFDFNDSDPQYFHGRAALTTQLLEKVEQSNFLAVLGASGSGKSSVVRAGLLHQLKQGTKPGSDGWKIYPPFTPGEHPLRSLEQVMGVEAKQFEALINAAAAERVVLVVDQFEEAFTLCRDNAEQQQFFECLMGAVKQLGNKLCLVLVMRADFFGKCAEQEYAGLAKAIEQNLVTVLPMTQQELREAITKPAEQVGLEVERELVTQMIADVEGSRGNLPLLQYTLTELWQQKSLNRLVLSEYTRLGGVKEALEKQANKVYDSFSSEEQQVAKRIFLALTQLGEGTENTRRRVRKQDLVTQQQSETIVERVLYQLAEAKLIITDRLENDDELVPVVDIAHEALIRHWQKLRNWLQENQKALIRKQDIEDAAQVWRDNKKPNESGYLLQGTRLAAAEDYLQRYGESVPLSSVAQEYVQVSQAERDRLRREEEARLQREIALRIEADRQRVDAQLIASSLLSENLLNSNKQLEGLIEAIRGGRLLQESVQQSIEVKPETRNRVVLALQQAVYGVRERNRLEGHNGFVGVVTFSPDGKMIVTNSGQNINLWNREGTLLMTFDFERSSISTVHKVSFSPDGKMIAAGVTIDSKNEASTWNFANSIYEVQIWSIDGQLLKIFKGHSHYVLSVEFSPDGKIIASASGDKTVKLWSIDGEELKTLNGHSDGVQAVSFSPDGQLLASASTDGIVRVWRVDGTSVKPLLGNHRTFTTGNPTSVSFSPDGKIFALANEGEVQLWNLEGTLLNISRFGIRVWFAPDGNVLTSGGNADGHYGDVNKVSFSSDGKILASAGTDKTIKLWNPDGSLIKTLEGHTAEVNDISFSPDGKILASASNDQTVMLWNFKDNSVKILRGHNAFVNSVSFSSSGLLASASLDKTVKLWLSDGTLVKTFNIGLFPTAKFSPDGKTLAVSSDKVALWNFDLDDLMVRGCNWVRDYLKTNPNVSESDRHLCDRIESSDP